MKVEKWDAINKIYMYESTPAFANATNIICAHGTLYLFYMLLAYKMSSKRMLGNKDIIRPRNKFS